MTDSPGYSDFGWGNQDGRASGPEGRPKGFDIIPVEVQVAHMARWREADRLDQKGGGEIEPGGFTGTFDQAADEVLRQPPPPEPQAVVARLGREGVDSVDQLEQKGIEIWPDGWRETFLSGRKMAFIDDPDGYEIELLERSD